MIVTASELLTLISVKSFRKTEYIDDGDTAVIRVMGADGKELAVVMPLKAALEMAHSVVESSRSIAPKGEWKPKG